MARGTPVLIDYRAASEPVNAGPLGWADIEAGQLIVIAWMCVRSSGFTDADMTSIGGLGNTTSYVQNMAWKIADGTEDASRVFGITGSTFFGNEPRYTVAMRFSGHDPDNPIWLPPLQEANTGTTIPAVSAPDGPFEGSKVFTVWARQTGTSAITAEVDLPDTYLYQFSSNADGDGYLTMGYQADDYVAADGDALDAATVTASATVRGRRWAVQGAELADPRFIEGDLGFTMDVHGKLVNNSQAIKDSDRAVGRREHIWVSDIHGVRKVVMR